MPEFPNSKRKTTNLSIIMSATDYREMSSTRMPPSKINKVLSGLAEWMVSPISTRKTLSIRQKHGISGLPTFSCITIRLEKEWNPVFTILSTALYSTQKKNSDIRIYEVKHRCFSFCMTLCTPFPLRQHTSRVYKDYLTFPENPSLTSFHLFITKRAT